VTTAAKARSETRRERISEPPELGTAERDGMQHNPTVDPV